MKFVKKENGNIIVTDDSDVRLRMIQDVPTSLEVLDDNDTILIRQNGLIVYQFQASSVTAYRILPATEVAFSGNANDFIDILSESFFLLFNSTTSSAITTAGSGLTKVGTSIVKLGGSITEPTTLSGNFDFLLALGTGDLNISCTNFVQTFEQRLQVINGIPVFTEALTFQTNSTTPTGYWQIALSELDVIWVEASIQYRRQGTDGAGIIKAFGGATRDSGADVSLLNGSMDIVQHDTIVGVNPTLIHTFSGADYILQLDGNSTTITDYKIIIKYSINAF